MKKDKKQEASESEMLCALRNIFHRIETKSQSQFTIDWQEEMLGIEEFFDPHKVKSFQDGKNYLASLAHRTGNILSIMKPDLPDYKYFEALNFIADNLPIYEWEFKK